MNLNEIVSAIQRGERPNRTVMIAIEGFGGSGKSTVAQQLSSALGDTYVIGIDDFIIKERLLELSPDEVGFDRARLEQQVLLPALHDKPIEYQRLEWVENKLSVPISVPKTSYLIIEGISSFHPDIEKYFDYKIWIDTPIEVAKQRGKLRDAGNENEQHWDLWAENDLAYQAKYHPEQHADFVVENGKETVCPKRGAFG